MSLVRKPYTQNKFNSLQSSLTSMISKTSIYIYIILVTRCLIYGFTKVSSSAYHIIHNDHPIQEVFGYLRENAPRYRSPPPPPILLSNRVQGSTSSAPTNPFAQFNPSYGAHFPTGGVAICAMAPPTCENSVYRTMDGSCNHLDNPALGVANSSNYINYQIKISNFDTENYCWKQNGRIT